MSPSTQARMASSVDSGNNIGKPSVGEVLAAAFIVAWASQYSTKLKLAIIVSLNGCFLLIAPMPLPLLLLLHLLHRQTLCFDLLMYWCCCAGHLVFVLVIAGLAS